MKNQLNEFINELRSAVNYDCRFNSYSEEVYGQKYLSVDMTVSDDHTDELIDDWSKLAIIADDYGFKYDDSRGKMEFSIPVEDQPECATPKPRKPHTNTTASVVEAAILAGLTTMAAATIFEYYKQSKHPENAVKTRAQRTHSALKATVKKPRVWLCTLGTMALAATITHLTAHKLNPSQIVV